MKHLFADSSDYLNVAFLANLIKLNLLPGDQALLQRTTNLNNIRCALQPHRWLRIIEAAGCKLVRLRNERFPEPTIKFRSVHIY